MGSEVKKPSEIVKPFPELLTYLGMRVDEHLIERVFIGLLG